jgi:hypothetical protein
MVLFHESKYSQPWHIYIYIPTAHRWQVITWLLPVKAGLSNYSNLNLNRIQGILSGQGDDIYAASVFIQHLSLNATIHITYIYSIAFLKIRRLIMLQGLPGIRHESVKLVCTVLTMPPLQVCTPGSFHPRDGSTNTIFGFSSISRPSRGASSVPRWDAICKCMNTWECNRWCITH